MSKNTRKYAQLALIAQMYYEKGNNQQEIADSTGINRTAISRLLSEARAKGIVKISVEYPWRASDLEQKLMVTFPHLKGVYVPTSIKPDHDSVLDVIGQYSAKFFINEMQPGMIVGMAWGRTIYEMIKYIPDENINIELVQITGATGHEGIIKDGSLISRILSDKLKCPCKYLHVPFLVESQELSLAMKKEKMVQNILQYAQKSDFTFTGIGSTQEGQYTLKETGYITYKEFTEIKKHKAVGDYLGVHYDIQGEVLDISINKRLIGSDPNDLLDVENRVAIAGGESKAEAILGAIRGKFFNVLITDNFTAQKVLDINSK